MHPEHNSAREADRAAMHRPQTREVMQHAILDLLDRGYSDHEIAAICKLSVDIVRQVIADRRM
jgi:hypothetical protein